MAEMRVSVEERSYTPEPKSHHHPYYQVIFPQRGELQLWIAGERGTVGGARFALVEPGVEHIYWAAGPNRFLVLDLSPAMLEEARDASSGPAGRAPAAAGLGPPYRSMTPRLVGLCSLLLAELAAGGLAERLVAESLGLYASALLLQSSPWPAPSPARRRLGRRVQAYLDAHYARDLSVREVAAAVGASASHVHRAFKETTGVSLVTYVHGRRLEAARELLRTTDRSVLEVALAVGFNDQSYFGRLFARATGLTPSRYRRLFRDDRDGCALPRG